MALTTDELKELEILVENQNNHSRWFSQEEWDRVRELRLKQYE